MYAQQIEVGRMADGTPLTVTVQRLFSPEQIEAIKAGTDD